MKALNAGLLVVGAALAGALALRLTEPPPISVTAPRTQLVSPQNIPLAAKATIPPAVRWRPAEPAIASAPPPVYTEPPPPPQLTRSAHSKPSPLPPMVAKAAPPPVPAPKPVPYQDLPQASQPKPDPARHVTLQAGDAVAVRMAEPVSAEGMKVGELFKGVLAEPLIADGFVVGERGAQVSGRVIAITRQTLTLRLLNFQTADGQRIEVSTEPITILSGNILRFRIAARITITERKI